MLDPGADALASISEIKGALAYLRDLGPRFTASDAHAVFVNFLATEFAKRGLVVEEDQYLTRRWLARRWALRLADQGIGTVFASSYFPFAGVTGPEGVSGSVLYLGPVENAFDRLGPDVSGRIVLVDCSATNHPFGFRERWGFCGVEAPPDTWHTAVGSWLPLDRLLRQLTDCGAVGMLVAWTNITEENASDQYQPILAHSVKKLFADGIAASDSGGTLIPALWVGPTSRSALIHAAGTGIPATITLEVDIESRAPTKTIVATLPGSTEETVVLVTHTDGVNVGQENGGLALLALAGAFAGLARRLRRRTVVFAAVTGHFGQEFFDPLLGVPVQVESEGLLALRPELITSAVAAITVEHLGQLEWLDDGRTYTASGKPELLHCITPRQSLAELAIECFGQAGVPATAMDARLWGLAQPFHDVDIPTLSVGSVASYLMSAAAGGHLEKISPELLSRQIHGLGSMVRALDRRDATALKR